MSEEVKPPEAHEPRMANPPKGEGHKQLGGPIVQFTRPERPGDLAGLRPETFADRQAPKESMEGQLPPAELRKLVDAILAQNEEDADKHPFQADHRRPDDQR